MSLTGVIDDRYAIERELGRGGMATVYLARDTRHGGRVAIKVLSPDIAIGVGGERFTREIRTTAQLQHPNILPVFDSGEVDGLPYYVMPYVEGQTLADRLAGEGALPAAAALDIACEVADALSHAHHEGFVHRDIKPGNILLAHGHAVVADFGIARAIEALGTDDGLTKAGIALGTAAYMSPEQAAAGKVDGRSDIYALGCVLYEMLAGHAPFAAATPHALMARHWSDTPPSIRTVRPSVSPAIEAIVMKAMAKQLAGRTIHPVWMPTTTDNRAKRALRPSMPMERRTLPRPASQPAWSISTADRAELPAALHSWRKMGFSDVRTGWQLQPCTNWLPR